jgi:DNA-binding NarL/FixJ family response regulator
MIGVLIVDDNAQIRNALRSELDAYADLRVIGEAGDGIEGFQLAQTLRPEVILMDVNMARLDGVETTRRIRTLLPQTILIGMSCHSREMVEQAILAAGADVFLPKDTLGEQLLPAVAQVLERRVRRSPQGEP